MGNHYHLLVETAEPNMIAGMKWLQGTCTRRFNARHRLFGHQLQGRYTVLVVDREEDDRDQQQGKAEQRPRVGLRSAVYRKQGLTPMHVGVLLLGIGPNWLIGSSSGSCSESDTRMLPPAWIATSAL